ncbi:MAG: hypothetical protein LV479_08320 [Methylacidiphilales bacterium]|nr:hypothetical protein [Candidatus Methylacidiphilales bacterium]
MRALRVHHHLRLWLCPALAFILAPIAPFAPALDKPTGAPLVLSSIETEQSVPLVYLDPDGKTAHCTNIKLHWNPNPNVGPNDEATSFTLDMASDNPAAPVFTAQLWNASLASALAWQQPWEGARWKVLQVPATDGTGIDAALAVGMIATSARRVHPDKTAVLGMLNPDGSLGPVSHLTDRLNAAAAAGMTRIIIPSVQRFDTDESGQVVNIVRAAGDLHIECVPVDNLVEATETVMNDPLPEVVSGPANPKYSDEVATYIDDFAHRAQADTEDSLKFAPAESDLVNYPPRLAAIWKSIFADYSAGQQAYRAGQVYVAFKLFNDASGRMAGANALAGQNRANFDVKAALAESDDLRDHLHVLMNPPQIDKDDLESAVLVAEMADWAYDINASLEGAQLVTKQAYSQRSDATDPEKSRAREAILFAIEQSKYLLNQADFYNGLLSHIGKGNPLPVDQNAANLLPQLVPAQLATARIFTDGIRQRANDLRDGLLFDPRLVAYVNVLREVKADWDARQRKKDMEASAAANAPSPTPGPANGAPGTQDAVKPNGGAPATDVAFDPGDTYRPPHTVVSPSAQAKKLSDSALCLIWVNNDCEIATLDEKYLRLNGTVEPTTHEWHVKDRAKLDALLQSAEGGARQGIAFAEKAEVDSSVLAMIYERASYLRIQNDDASALEALRNYWRCALLGNMCWQLAHTHKAQPVDLGPQPPVAKTGDKSKPEPSPTPPAPSPSPAPMVVTSKLPSITPAPVPTLPPVPPRALPVEETAANPTPTPTPAPVPTAMTPVAVPVAPAVVETPSTNSEPVIPVAPIARVEDYTGANEAATTNAAPVIGPTAPTPENKSDNADGHAGAFP